MSMTRNTGMKRLGYGWCYLLPEVAAPIGGGLIKIGQASTWAAVSVGLAPYVIVAALYAIFMLEHVPVVICYLCSSRERQDAIDRLITTSANAIVALLTLTPTNNSASRTPRADKSRLRALKGGPDETSEQDA
jgi:hypothetical protein